MTVGRINLAELRHKVAGGAYEWVSLSQDQEATVLALLDAVEAAQAYFESLDAAGEYAMYMEPVYADRDVEAKAREALAAFDVGGDA